MPFNIIKPPKTIGIIGGGQLGRMLSFSAKQMGYRVVILDPKLNCSAAQVSDEHLVFPYDHQEGLRRLYDLSDVITYEFENIPYRALSHILSKVPQGNFPLKFTQDRLVEKQTIIEAGFKTAPFAEVNDWSDVRKLADRLGYPVILKTRSGGYDGKGQQRIHSNEDPFEFLGPSIIEKVVPLKKEVSLIITRSIHKEITCFPVFDNIHKDQRLVETSMPTTLDHTLEQNIMDIGLAFVENIDLIGTLAIEFFITDDDEIIINECAPRVHNSGHLTIEACEVSQFEQHIRAITGLPLKQTNPLKKALMVNIYGQDFKEALELMTTDANLHVHLYGKKSLKTHQKIGHITVCSNEDEIINQYRLKLREKLNTGV